MIKSIMLILFSLSIHAETEKKNEIYKESFKNGNQKYEVTYLNGEKNGKEIFWTKMV